MNNKREALMQHPDAYVPIVGCRVCHSKVYTIVDLGSQYLVDFVDNPDEEKLYAPLELVRCEVCELVQLSVSVNPDLMYRDFWYRSGINESMCHALMEIVASAVSKVSLREGDAVLDIGCNDGTLLEFYPASIWRAGIDPSNVAQEAASKANTVLIDYFTHASAHELARKAKKKFKIITAIAMFYDLENPLEFLKDCACILDKDGVLVIQMNYLYSMVNNLAFDNICHEHLTYFSLTPLLELASKANLAVVDVSTNEVNGGSFRVYIKHKAVECTTPAVVELRRKEKFLEANDWITSFNVQVSETKQIVNNAVKDLWEGGKNIFAYGASTRGSTLLQTLGCSKYLMGAAERDERKLGKMTVGSWLRIHQEFHCRRAADYFLVLPYHFKKAILERERLWIAAGGKFIFPLPVPTLVTKDGEYLLKDVLTCK